MSQRLTFSHLVSQQKLMEEIAINCVSEATYKFALTGPDPKLTKEEAQIQN